MAGVPAKASEVRVAAVARAKRLRELTDLVVCFMFFIWVKTELTVADAKALCVPKENTKT